MKRFMSMAVLCAAGFTVPQHAAAQDSCAIFAFEGGTSIINSATSINGDVCYNDGVTSISNQKAENFVGTAKVHSGATFAYTDKNFLPTGGIVVDGSVDPFLAGEDARLKTLSSDLAALSATVTPGSSVLNSDWLVSSAANDVTVVELSGVDFNSNTITLDGPGGFVFNIAGAADFKWADSVVNLVNGATAGNVYWNFTGAADIIVNKATTLFAGLILAPLGSVEYHNPATFNGAIAALNINVHSDFNLSGVSYGGFEEPSPIPLPAPMWMLLGGVMSIRILRRRNAAAARNAAPAFA